MTTYPWAVVILFVFWELRTWILRACLKKTHFHIFLIYLKICFALVKCGLGESFHPSDSHTGIFKELIGWCVIDFYSNESTANEPLGQLEENYASLLSFNRKIFLLPFVLKVLFSVSCWKDSKNENSMKQSLAITWASTDVRPRPVKILRIGKAVWSLNVVLQKGDLI